MLDDWPSPPLYQYLLLENPWPLVGVAAAVAVLLFVAGSRQGRQSLQVAALAALIFGGGVFASTRLVTTERERLQQATREVVHAFAEQPFDRATIERHTADEVMLYDGPPGDFVSVAESAARRVDLDRYFIRRVVVNQDGPHHAQTGVGVMGTLTYRGVRSRFGAQALFFWRRTSDDRWELYHVRDVTVNGRSAAPYLDRMGY